MTWDPDTDEADDYEIAHGFHGMLRTPRDLWTWPSAWLLGLWAAGAALVIIGALKIGEVLAK